MTRTIETQIADMARLWPQLALAARAGNRAVWQGPLKPLLQTFQVRIVYRVPLVVERPDVRNTQPEVTVLAPPLRRRPGDAEGALPHVYYRSDGSVVLCMLDPEADDWSPADSLAETTVPWIIEWLAAYEGWRATGHWTASGRHVEAA
ncbi:hypothetical protein [Brevundimonas sp. UBA2416]|uniref:hypothetical protein n=1 Tax=Brevundimonas sp. UBA2416 TaxID=1946124 RepID=UPI0025BDE446|nr:hypothetical protein [Brevundimonas sp. UBA2416]HRJ63288.1 hypothetical protein [Brevundimonas sp.]